MLPTRGVVLTCGLLLKGLIRQGKGGDNMEDIQREC